MTFPKYEHGEDSGVGWLGELPTHWQLRRMKFLFKLTKRSPSEQDDVVTAFRDGVVTLRLNRRTDGFTEAVKEIGYQGIRVGDLVIHAMDAFAGAIGVSDSNGKCSPVYSVCEPQSDEVDVHYYGRLLRHMALTGFITSLAKGIRERSTDFRWSEASNVMLPFPPAPEQRAIATFLDRETAKIDALVAEQKRLIGLLKEKRQAIISHAVTKGLDPNVKMKDSGVEWLGEVPEHWGRGSFAKVTDRVVVGIAEAATHAYADDGIPILRSTNIRPNRIVGEMLYVLPEYANERGSKLINAGDLVTVRTGSPGVTVVIPQGLDGCQCFTMLISSVSAHQEPRYFSYFLNSEPARFYFTLVAWGSAQRNISVPLLKAIPVLIPPQAEQQAIVDLLDRETSKIDELVEEVEMAITLLQERRSALISAAVTGKIDVRGFVGEGTEAA